MENVNIISGPKSWIEDAAVQQLETVAKRPGMVRVIGMPNLHPGEGGCPVGVVFCTDNMIYPDLIGSDIGCGMALWATSIRETRHNHLAKKLSKIDLDVGVENPERLLQNNHIDACGFEHSLGTIGRSNHFAELLVLDQVFNLDSIENICDDRVVFLLVHSGSRGFGEQILREHTSIHGTSGLCSSPDGVYTPEATDYLKKHTHAVVWANLNRMIIADRIFEALEAHGNLLFDTTHNYVERYQHLWVHRKGAIPARSLMVIPGSRGSHSYLVAPRINIGNTGWSVSHGDGRKINRIDQVIQDHIDHGMIKVIATLRPLITYKLNKHDR